MDLQTEPSLIAQSEKRKRTNSKIPFLVPLAVMLLLSACASPPENEAPPATENAQDLSSAPTASEQQPEPSPRPTKVPSELVWFGPNMGSVDYVELFTDPIDWFEARGRIDVFRFHSSVLFPVSCSICGDNNLRRFVSADAFRQLIDWGIAIGIEVGAIYEDGCLGEKTFIRDAGVVIRGVEENGGKVSFLAMDEPLFHGGRQPLAGSCDYSMEEAAVETANFVKAVNVRYPDIIVGDTEPYPEYSVSQMEDWIIALRENGVPLPFFHLDVDIERVRVEGQDVAADLRELRQFCESQSIAFGVIFTSNWTQANSNRAYFASTMGWVQTVEDAIGRPDHVVFESWQGPARGPHEVPVNLPKNDPEGYSHIDLLLDGLDLLGN